MTEKKRWTAKDVAAFFAALDPDTPLTIWRDVEEGDDLSQYYSFIINISVTQLDNWRTDLRESKKKEQVIYRFLDGNAPLEEVEEYLQALCDKVHDSLQERLGTLKRPDDFEPVDNQQVAEVLEQFMENIEELTEEYRREKSSTFPDSEEVVEEKPTQRIEREAEEHRQHYLDNIDMLIQISLRLEEVLDGVDILSRISPLLQETLDSVHRFIDKYRVLAAYPLHEEPPHDTK